MPHPEPADAPVPRASATRPPGPLCIVVNAGSGKDAAGARTTSLRELLAANQLPYRLFELRPAGAMEATISAAIAVAEAENGVIVASGGDGTLSAVVQLARHSKQPFAILPQGTFNYFGRSLGISSDLAVAVPGLADADIEYVQIGLINEHAFLVNASLGLYPELLEQRELAKQRFGRSRMVAFAAAIRTLLSEHASLRLQVEEESGAARELRTPTLFVGNNALQLARVGIPEADDVEGRGRLAAIVLRAVSRMQMVGLMVRGALGSLGQAAAIDSFAFRQLSVQLGASGRSRRVKLACDGETVWLRSPLKFSAAPRGLRMLLPKQRYAGDPG